MLTTINLVAKLSVALQQLKTHDLNFESFNPTNDSQLRIRLSQNGNITAFWKDLTAQISSIRFSPNFRVTVLRDSKLVSECKISSQILLLGYSEDFACWNLALSIMSCLAKQSPVFPLEIKLAFDNHHQKEIDSDGNAALPHEHQ